MPNVLPPLQIAKPCPQKWEALRGDAKRRFCPECQLHVHNLSAMSAPEREEFVATSGGHQCIAYFRHRDGSMATPSRWDGLRQILAPLRWSLTSALAALLPVTFAGCAHRLQTVGSVDTKADTHQQKTAHARPDGEILLGEPLPPPEKPPRPARKKPAPPRAPEEKPPTP